MSTPLNYAHCFRKQFTSSIYEKLKNGDSINIVGRKGTGRKRLLEDIQMLSLQEGITALVVDINTWIYNFKGFEYFIQEQLIEKTVGLLEAPQEPSSKALVPSGSVSRVLAKHINNHRQIFLLLNNYDALLNNEKQRFPKSFFDDLNSLKNKPNISLCLNTQISHRQCRVWYKDENGAEIESGLSNLDLDIIDILRPTMAEVREEIQKRLSKSVIWKEEPQQELFIDHIRSHQAPMDLMEIIGNSFLTDLDKLSADIRLKHCYDAYVKNYRRRKDPAITKRKAKDFVEWLTDQISKVFKITIGNE